MRYHLFFLCAKQGELTMFTQKKNSMGYSYASVQKIGFVCHASILKMSQLMNHNWIYSIYFGQKLLFKIKQLCKFFPVEQRWLMKLIWIPFKGRASHAKYSLWTASTSYQIPTVRKCSWVTFKTSNGKIIEREIVSVHSSSLQFRIFLQLVNMNTILGNYCSHLVRDRAQLGAL